MTSKIVFRVHLQIANIVLKAYTAQLKLLVDRMPDCKTSTSTDHVIEMDKSKLKPFAPFSHHMV